MNYRTRKIFMTLALVFLGLWLLGILCLFALPSGLYYTLYGSGFAFLLLSIAWFFVRARWFMFLLGVICLIVYGVLSYIDRTAPAGAPTVGVYRAPRVSSGGYRRVRFTGSNDGYPIDVTRNVSGVLDIGRDAHCGLCIDNGSVSRRHVRLTVQNGLLYAVNLSATNPARLNGLRFDTMTPLKSGDALTLGAVTVLLSIA